MKQKYKYLFSVFWSVSQSVRRFLLKKKKNDTLTDWNMTEGNFEFG